MSVRPVLVRPFIRLSVTKKFFLLKSPWNRPQTLGVDPWGWPRVALGHAVPLEELARTRRTFFSLFKTNTVEQKTWTLGVYRCKMAFFNWMWQKVKVLSRTWASKYTLAFIRALKWATVCVWTPSGFKLSVHQILKYRRKVCFSMESLLRLTFFHLKHYFYRHVCQSICASILPLFR